VPKTTYKKWHILLGRPIFYIAKVQRKIKAWIKCCNSCNANFYRLVHTWVKHINTFCSIAMLQCGGAAVAVLHSASLHSSVNEPISYCTSWRKIWFWKWFLWDGRFYS